MIRVPLAAITLSLLLASAACTKMNTEQQVPPQATIVIEKTIEKPTEKTIVVTVHHDTVCPWCRIGCANLQAALKGWQGPPVTVRYLPFLLDPNTPVAGRDLREHLGDKYGHQRIAAMFMRVTEVGRKAGLTFRFDKVRTAPDSSLSHALIEWAPDTSKRFLLEVIQQAYFERGANIGDVAVLADLAGKAGLDPAAARAMLERPETRADIKAKVARARTDITGVPHFVIDGGQQFQGAVPAERLKTALLKVAAGSGAANLSK